MTPLAGILLVAPLLLLILATPTVSADWLQTGHDAAQTGAVDGIIPNWNDIAVTLPIMQTGGGSLAVANPVIVGGTVHFVIPKSLESPTSTNPSASVSVLYSVDLGAPEPVGVARIEWPMYGMASDGEHLFLLGNYRLMAWTPGNTEPDWDVMLYTLAPEANGVWTSAAVQFCGGPVVQDSTVVVGCLSPSPSGDYNRLLVAAFDAATGEPVWAEPWDSLTALPHEPECGDDFFANECGTRLLRGNGFPAFDARAPMMSLVGDQIYVAASHRTTFDGERFYGGYTLYSIQLSTGMGQMLERYDALMAGEVTWGAILFPAPTGNADWMYAKGYALRRYSANASAPGEFTAAPIRDTHRELDLGSGLGLRGEALFATTLTKLVRVNLAMEPDPFFTPFQLPAGEAWDRGGLLVSDDLVLARATQPTSEYESTHTILYAIEARSGSLAWRHTFEGPTNVAASDGLVVAIDATGTFTVLGSAGFSPRAVASTTSQYPAPGDAVVVDLARSSAGLFGPVASYRAEWGDGFVDPWQSDPVFIHRYSDSSDRIARFHIRNEAGQTASITIAFFVGQDDPTRNILNAPFSDQFQETSFFLLGILITALLALVGIYRAGRKRRRFERALREIEADYERLSADSPACDRMLHHQRTTTRALFLGKRIEEAHASFLMSRIDELRRGLRFGTMDARLKFLPHGMVLHLQRLLTDARIDDYERDHFLAALELESSLTNRQKAEVAAVVDSWFTLDANERP